ncbi:MAG TPA: hypothetical protein VGK67_09920 [Myxococcales bacterium]|jgi:hypothetical protein
MSKASGLGILCVALALCVAGPQGCSCGDDAERAAKERAKIQQKVESSLVLVPYRGLKVLLRSAGLNERTPEVQRLLEKFPGPDSMPEKVESPDDAKRIATTVLEAAVLLYESRVVLSKDDEDKLPMLWRTWTKHDPPFTWYGNEAEHLAFASAWTLGQIVDPGNKSHSMEFAFYELTRATPKDGWPLPVKLWGRLARGLGFSAAEYRYAAEEELDAYIALADGLTPEQDAQLAMPFIPKGSAEVVRAAGHVARAWNRIGLSREKLAADDLEQALDSLGKVGIDNELTQWAWAFVHYVRGKNAEAAKDLLKLAESPNLDESAKNELREAAKNIEKQKPGIFGSVKAGTVIGGALLTRAGGMDKILETVFGGENAKTLHAPLIWFNKMREGVSEYASADAITGALREKAKEGTAKGLDLLKQKVGEVPNPLKGKAEEAKPDAGTAAAAEAH